MAESVKLDLKENFKWTASHQWGKTQKRRNSHVAGQMMERCRGIPRGLVRRKGSESLAHEDNTGLRTWWLDYQQLVVAFWREWSQHSSWKRGVDVRKVGPGELKLWSRHKGPTSSLWARIYPRLRLSASRVPIPPRKQKVALVSLWGPKSSPKLITGSLRATVCSKQHSAILVGPSQHHFSL